ncbi:hypothetical protein LEP1GSC082_0363 [Leptospira kirschneri str. H2]|nr:hypothetical protein LEP1GSC082_0363 [Leptospira kirschneri str. H2]
MGRDKVFHFLKRNHLLLENKENMPEPQIRDLLHFKAGPKHSNF